VRKIDRTSTDNNLISRSEMFKALGIEYDGPDALLDKKVLESQLANKEWDHRTEILWEIKIEEGGAE